jgi:hypothetical protein
MFLARAAGNARGTRLFLDTRSVKGSLPVARTAHKILTLAHGAAVGPAQSRQPAKSGDRGIPMMRSSIGNNRDPVALR